MHFGAPSCSEGILDDWRRLLHTCLHLKTVGVMYHFALKMFKLLRETQEVQTSRGQKIVQPVAPEVESIHLTEVGWRIRDEAETDDSSEFIRDLMHLLRIRHNSLLPIKKLVIRRCYDIDAIHVNQLRSQGCIVEWDNSASQQDNDVLYELDNDASYGWDNGVSYGWGNSASHEWDADGEDHYYDPYDSDEGW